MSKYEDHKKDDLYYEMFEFLKDHELSELIKVLKDVVEEKEEGF